MCCSCKKVKPVNEFRFRNKAAGIRQCFCAACKSTYNKKWYIKHRKEQVARTIRNKKTYVAAAKEYVDGVKNQPCTDCGKRFHACAMDFDHLADDKEYEIARMVAAGLTVERIAVEIKKCELVCSNCHRIRTYKRNHMAP